MRLDIIIMAYNCTKTLPRALDSLVAQTNSEFNVIVIDDGSTDNPYTVVEKYIDKLNIRYIQNDHNIGVTMTRQRGMDETTAEYFAFLDADDVLFPNAVEVWKKELELSNPDVIITPFVYLEEKPAMIKPPVNMIACHGKVYKSEFLKKYAIREPESVKCVEDTYLNWVVFALAEKVSMLKDIVYMQIKTAGSVTSKKEWIKNSFNDLRRSSFLAIRYVLKFKKNLKQNYEPIENKFAQLLLDEAENHKNFINNIIL